MISMNEKTISFRNLLLIGNFFCFCALLVSYTLKGPTRLVDGISIFLCFLYFIVLSISLFSFKKASRPVVYLFVFTNLILYAHRTFFLHLFPEYGRYTPYFAFNANNTNDALYFLLICTIAAIAGFKTGELFPNSEFKLFRKEWFERNSNRLLFYIVSCVVMLTNIILSLLFFNETYQKLWSDNFFVKLLLHFIVYNAIYLYIPMLILVHPKIVKSKRERKLLTVIFILVILQVVVSISKGVLFSIFFAYLCAKLTLHDFKFSKIFVGLSMTALLLMGVMFPFHKAIQNVMLNSTQTRVQSFIEGYQKSTAGYLGDLLAFSRRVGGIDWISVCMLEEANTMLKRHITLKNTIKHACNRLIPIPKIFPETLGPAAGFIVAVRQVSSEDTKHVNEYPTLLGFVYLLFGYGGALIIFLWGFICILMMRMTASSDIKILFLVHLMFGLFLSGLFVSMLKQFFIYFFFLWFIRLFMFKRKEMLDNLARRHELNEIYSV